MEHKVRTLTTLGIGLIVFIVTLIIFFLGYTNRSIETINFLGLIFVLISEIALFGSSAFILSKNYSSSRMILVFGITSTLFIYWITTSIILIFSKNIFGDNIRGFVTTQIIILAIALIISIALYASGINLSEHDSELKYLKTIMKDCETLAFSLKSNPNFDSYSSLLNKIYEEIKYSDKTKSVEIEQTIYEKLGMLNELLSDKENKPKTEDILANIDEIVLLIKERNLSVLQLNQGGF